jgi:ADP-heptose:LPS heptosyltransferase
MALRRRRVLAVRQDNNGDVTLLGPALRAMAAAAEVVLVCAPSGEGAARLLPGVAAVEVVRAEWIAADPRPVERDTIAADVARFAALGADEALIFTSFHQSPLPTALLLRLAGIPRVAAISVDYPGALLDERVRVSDDLHEVERALALAGACGYRLAPDDDGALRYVPLPPRLPGLPVDYVALQPGATAAARAWAPSKMRALAAYLHAEGHAVVVLGSAAERDLCRYVSDDCAVDLSGRTSFAQFAAAVRDARALVVGNSSGIHVASAVGTPVVSIFAPTIPWRRFAPWRVPHVLLGDADIACAGCRARTCPVAGQPCTGGVEPADVAAALGSLGIRPDPVSASAFEVIA